MAKTPRNLPVNYPQPLAGQLLKADFQRQASMLRQEIVSDLLGVLTEAREPNVRRRLARLVESNLKLGIAAAGKAADLWPEIDDVKEMVEGRTEIKPATAKKHLKLFEQFDRVQRRSLALLENSFESIRVILDRLQPPEQAPVQPAPPAPPASAKRPAGA